MEYTVEYFLDKFSKISERRWTIQRFFKRNFFAPNQHCAQGFCLPKSVLRQMAKSKFSGTHGVNYGLVPELIGLFRLFGTPSKQTSVLIASINNGLDERYQQPTPKARILAALHDIKKLQEGQEDKIKEPVKDTKVITKYVAVYPEVKELMEEKILETIQTN